MDFFRKTIGNEISKEKVKLGFPDSSNHLCAIKALGNLVNSFLLEKKVSVDYRPA